MKQIPEYSRQGRGGMKVAFLPWTLEKADILIKQLSRAALICTIGLV